MSLFSANKKTRGRAGEVTLEDISTISNDLDNHMVGCSEGGSNSKVNTSVNFHSVPELESKEKSPLGSANTSGSSGSSASPILHTRGRRFYKHRKYKHETSDDKNRKEMLWTGKIEEKLNMWHHSCITNAKWHSVKAKHHRKIFYGLGIPAAIIPMMLASASELLDDDWKIFSVMSLILSGILNIISGFLTPGQKSEAHLNFNALYNELAVEITSELVKPQSYRYDADVFIQRIMDNYNSLNNRAPMS